MKRGSLQLGNILLLEVHICNPCKIRINTCSFHVFSIISIVMNCLITFRCWIFFYSHFKQAEKCHVNNKQKQKVFVARVMSNFSCGFLYPKYFFNLTYISVMPELGGPGGHGTPNFWQISSVTLLQPGRADYPHLLLLFFTFRHHCNCANVLAN